MPGPKPTTQNLTLGAPNQINNLDYMENAQGISIVQPPYLDENGKIQYDPFIVATLIQDLTSGISYSTMENVINVILGDIWGYVANKVGPPNMQFGGTVFTPVSTLIEGFPG